ncbi:tyrosine-type recombinase/integrase [Rhodoblastus sp.]|uniref:tyrosine-type recombinase/integrase n=1 Tax=Rhodoblastus sp. TaxID=1962975 RepID=UPI003F9939A3
MGKGPAKALTELALQNFKPGSARREIPDGKVGGLYYVLQPSGSASWALRYRHLGKSCKLTIGGGAIPLKDARDLARQALVKIARGESPGAEKVAARKAARASEGRVSDLIEKIVPAFIDKYAKRNCRESTWKEYDRILNTNVVKVWRCRRLGEIARADVHDLLDGMIARGAEVQANRTFATFRKLCNWAQERGVIDFNPCNGLKAPTQEQARDRVLSDDEIRWAWRAFEMASWPFGKVGQLLLLTGARRDEIGEARWTEFDADRKMLVLPPARMKAGAAHEIPLCDAAIKIIESLPKIAAKGKDPIFLFTTNGDRPVSGYSRAKEQFDRTIYELVKAERGADFAAPAHWLLHDLRRTVATNLQRLGTRLEVTEAILGHVSGSRAGIVGIYQRHNFAEEKRAALEAWARRLDEIVSGKPAGNVVELASART